MIDSTKRTQFNKFLIAGLLLTLALAIACQQAPTAQQDTRAADETALRNLDAQWSKDAATKDPEKWVAYYTDDALLLPANMPAATGKEAIRPVIKGLMSAPGFGINWKASKVDVSRSGDMGYVSGTYELTVNDQTGKVFKDNGKYLAIYKKQPDGSWKAAVDTWNSDLPMPGASPEKK